MPFVSQPYMASLSADQHRSLVSAHTNIGYHPETYDELHIPQIDRYAGTYVLGVQGSGKSGLMQNLIVADMQAGHAVTVIDPHGDLTAACLHHVPPERMQDVFLLDMEDEGFPFGVNIFSTGKLTSSLAATQAVERLMHIFEVLWPDVLSQQNLPRYVRAAAITFLCNPGSTLVDMHSFLQDGAVRSKMLANVTDPTVRQFWHTQYDSLSPHEQYRRVQPLIGRLEALFMGRSLVRNIVGQRRTTISFRKTIENRQIVFIKLPIKTVAQDARLIGTILLSQIHAAVFSFADIPEAQRPGVSLYVDEFQHFATSDFAELFTEGRKFGVRLVIAHQYRSQVPSFLRDSTMTARTKVCFQATPEDGRELAHVFPSNEATVQPDDIEPHPVHYLLAKTPDDPVIQLFTELYLRPLQGQTRGHRVEIYQRGAPTLYDFMNGGRSENPRWSDPTPYLDSLLYQVMITGNPSLDIPADAVRGFANCGRGFYKKVIGLADGDKRLTYAVNYPKALVVTAADGSQYWTRPPEDDTEALYHFIFHLRLVMQRLAEQPIGKATTASPTEVGRMLTQLPRRSAFVRSGDTVGVIYTHDTPPLQTKTELLDRLQYIVAHTRETYCHPREEVERLFMQPPAQPTASVQPVSRWEEIE